MLWLLLQRRVRNLELEGNSENPPPYSKTRCSVKQSKGTRLDRIFLLKATLLVAVVVPTLTSTAYGRQEVDPTWYDPWAAQTKVVVPPAQPRVAHHKPQRKVSSVTPNRHPWTSPSKRSASTEASRARNEVVSQRNHF